MRSNAFPVEVIDPVNSGARIPKTQFRVGIDLSALDAGFKAHAGRGIGRYVQELKNYFDKVGSDAEHVGNFDHRSFNRATLLDRMIDKLPAGKHTVKQQIVYPLRLWKGSTSNFDLLHFPAHMDAPSWSIKNYVITVLDLIPLVMSDLYRASNPGWRYRLARSLEIRAIKRASLILAISENTAKDVQRILNIPAERIRVTPLGVDAKFFQASAPESARLRASYNLPNSSPVILYVGGIDPRKNWRGLLQSFEVVAKSRLNRGLSAPILLMAGRIQQDKEFPALKALIDQLGIAELIRMPGFVADGDLLQLYALSNAFFFPSLYEGFGLPPLEAMAAGLPVVSSNTSAMPEVLGDAALLVDPNSIKDCADGLIAVLENQVLSQSLKTKGPQQARNFTWDKTGELTLKAYASMDPSCKA